MSFLSILFDGWVQKSQFILKVMPDIFQFAKFLWQWAMSVATLCLPHYSYCIKGMNESAVGRWGPEGKRGTNGALMKISSLLINVEIYTHHAHGLGMENKTQRLHTHTHRHTQTCKKTHTHKQMCLSCHLLIMLSFYLLSPLSHDAICISL